MGIPDYLTCLLRNLYAEQEATVRTRHGATDWFKLGKNYVKAIYCHLDYLTYMQSTSCEMLDWMTHKLGSRLPGDISTPQICSWNHFNGSKQRGNKEPLDEGERKWKSWLKFPWVFLFSWRKSFPYLGERIFMNSSCSEEQLSTKASVSPYLMYSCYWKAWNYISQHPPHRSNAMWLDLAGGL